MGSSSRYSFDLSHFLHDLWFLMQERVKAGCPVPNHSYFIETVNRLAVIIGIFMGFIVSVRDFRRLYLGIFLIFLYVC